MNKQGLRVEGLSKSFGKKRVVDRLSFEFCRGEVMGFLGPNGAGKTTTIKMMMGFLRPDEGRILIDGEEISKHPEAAKLKMGGIVENPDMYGEFTARQNLLLTARCYPKVRTDRVDELLAQFRLEKRKNDLVKTYSLGMKQRLGLAQALLHDPEILILDEPTNGLDPAGIRDLRIQLQQLAHQEGKAILVSSHLLAEMELLCDRVTIIQQGVLQSVETIHQQGKKEGVLAYRLRLHAMTDEAKALLRAPFIEQDGEDFLLHLKETEISDFMLRFLQAGGQIYQCVPVEHSLEEVFLSRTGGDQIA